MVKLRCNDYGFECDFEVEGDEDHVVEQFMLGVNSSKLGGFAYENSDDDVYVLQNGIYRFNRKWKQRGLGKLGTKEIEHLETYEKDGKLFYKFNVLRNSRLRSSIIQNKIKDIGKIKPIEREINLNADRKRLWLGRIKNIDQTKHNESVSLSLNFIDKDRI